MSNPTELPDLDACPFCKGGNIQIRSGKALAYAYCDSCQADGPLCDTEHDAASAWNRRAQPEGEAPQAEPVAWMTGVENGNCFTDEAPSSNPDANGWHWTPLYTGGQMQAALDARSDEYQRRIRFLQKATPAATLSPLCGAQHAESGAPAAVKRALELYAESYDRMSRMGDGKVASSDVAYDIDSNMIPSVLKALAAQQAAAPGAQLVIGVAAPQGATISIMQPHADGTTTVIYGGTHPAGDSMGRAVVAAAPSAPGTPEAPDTRRLALLLRSDGYRFELMNQQQHLLDPRGRIAGKGVTKRDAIDDALGIPRAAQLDGGQEGSESNA